ncbi:hypothetical protein [Caldifermentibacillus hisashii]|uniref:hypothetical protein n=1 Tax=Caldifermentibacillus hisashii TaxID=996558 RepID=UPI003100CAC7
MLQKYDLKEISKLLGIPSSTFSKLMREGRLPLSSSGQEILSVCPLRSGTNGKYHYRTQ